MSYELEEPRCVYWNIDVASKGREKVNLEQLRPLASKLDSENSILFPGLWIDIEKKSFCPT
jgi:hypothetical protein